MESNEDKDEYVYVMSNPSFADDTLKVGYTREHPSIRANDLHTSGLPTPFYVEFVIITNSGSKLEKIIHEHIKQYRLKSNREFFKISKDTLVEILETELNLELKLINEINEPPKKIKGKKINEIKTLFEKLDVDYNEFISKFNKENSDLRVTEYNNKKHVSIIDFNNGRKSALEVHGWEDDFESHIKIVCHFIEKDISTFKKWLDDLLNHYEEIKERIGVENLRKDNKSFKEMILKRQTDLNKLVRGEYTWEF